MEEVQQRRDKKSPTKADPALRNWVSDEGTGWAPSGVVLEDKLCRKCRRRVFG
jgi:hypothetical protein